MHTSIRQAMLLPTLVAASVLAAPSAASASPDPGGQVSEEGVIAPGSKQHGGDAGHLPPVQENVELVGRADIDGAAEGRVADVAAFGNFAYLTVRDPEGCVDTGVAIMDISDPTAPKQAGFIDATEGLVPR